MLLFFGEDCFLRSRSFVALLAAVGLHLPHKLLLADLLHFLGILCVDGFQLIAFVDEDLLEILQLVRRHDWQDIHPVLPLFVIHALGTEDQLDHFGELLLHLIGNRQRSRLCTGLGRSTGGGWIWHVAMLQVKRMKGQATSRASLPTRLSGSRTRADRTGSGTSPPLLCAC